MAERMTEQERERALAAVRHLVRGLPLETQAIFLYWRMVATGSNVTRDDCLVMLRALDEIEAGREKAET
jgi:radical SAM superfamily enzyme